MGAREYRIIQFREDGFKIKYKWFCFWLYAYGGYADSVLIFKTKAEAEQEVLKLATEYNKDRKDAKFKKQVFHYREDGQPCDFWLPARGPGL